MWQRFITLASNTFVETIRQPIYGVLLVVTAGLMILNVSLAGFTLENDNKLLMDLGLSTLLLSGLFLAAFSATGVISREIENKTVLTVISKPVGRPVFILGKFAGLIAALSLAFFLGALIFILALRHGVLQNSSDPWDAPVLTFGVGSLVVATVTAAFCNYFYGSHFATTTLTVITPLLTVSVLLVAKFDKHFDVIPFASDFVGGQVLLATYLVLLAVAITTAVAVAASTRFGQMMTLLICTFVLGLGIISDWVFGQYDQTSIVAAAAYRIVPNIGPFWVIDGLQAAKDETAITGQYVVYVTAYAALFTSAILGIAVALFQKREVG
ncbi:MAG: ABC transporter permease subunit [Planctomycetota bacterium]